MLEPGKISLADKRVLVVDDDCDMRGTLKDLLMSSGASVELARNVDEATRILKTKEVDAILSEMNLPFKSGVTLFRWCQTSGVSTRGNPTPFILMSSQAEQVSPEDAKTIGVHAILPKPPTRERLLETLASAMMASASDLFERSHLFVPIPMIELQEGRDIRFPVFAIFNQPKDSLISRGMPVRVGESSHTISPSFHQEMDRIRPDRIYIRAKEAFRFYGFSSKIDTFQDSEVKEQGPLWKEIFQDYEEVCQHFKNVLKIDGEVYRYAVTLGESALKLALHSRELQASFLQMRAEAKERYRGALAAGVFSVATMTLMGWESLPVRLHVSFSALLIELFLTGKVKKLPADISSCVSETVLGVGQKSGENTGVGIRFKVPPLVSIIQTSRQFCEYLFECEKNEIVPNLSDIRSHAQTRMQQANPFVVEAVFKWLDQESSVKVA